MIKKETKLQDSPLPKATMEDDSFFTSGSFLAMQARKEVAARTLGTLVHKRT